MLLVDMYDNEQLKKIQKIELSILKDFDSICNNNNLNYFIIGGTAIGAIRHNGFIPWDDDIDVAMEREDYDKFLTIAKSYRDKYNIVNNDNYPKLAIMNTRWSLKGTKFVTKEFNKLKDIDDFGIFLDIYCFENILDDERETKRQITKAWILGKLAIMSEINNPVLYFKGITRILLRIGCFVGHYILKLFGCNANRFYRMAIKEASKYKNIETKRFTYMFDPKRYLSLLNKDDIYPTIRVKFEDMYVSAPKNIDKVLTLRYGNYLKIPDEKDRHCHPPYVLDFGKEDII